MKCAKLKTFESIYDFDPAQHVDLIDNETDECYCERISLNLSGKFSDYGSYSLRFQIAQQGNS